MSEIVRTVEGIRGNMRISEWTVPESSITERTVPEGAVSAIPVAAAESEPERTVGTAVPERDADERVVVRITIGEVAAPTEIVTAV